MADVSQAQAALTRELSSANYDADDLPNLARNVYVRCLLKVHSVSGPNNSAKQIALQVTGSVLKQIVGMHFTVKDVQSLLDEQERGPAPAGDQAAKPAPKPIDPYDLGM
jgi:hypothetical protein